MNSAHSKKKFYKSVFDFVNHQRILSFCSQIKKFTPSILGFNEWLNFKIFNIQVMLTNKNTVIYIRHIYLGNSLLDTNAKKAAFIRVKYVILVDVLRWLDSFMCQLFFNFLFYFKTYFN